MGGLKVQIQEPHALIQYMQQPAAEVFSVGRFMSRVRARDSGGIDLSVGKMVLRRTTEKEQSRNCGVTLIDQSPSAQQTLSGKIRCSRTPACVLKELLNCAHVNRGEIQS